jgi:ubiquitin-like 1-activating enzyme E1 A
MNPRVLTSAFSLSPLALTPDLLATYTVTVANSIPQSLPYPALTQLNLSTRFVNRPFYATGIHGLYGYIFADLIQHEFVIEREKSNVPLTPGTAESSTRTIVSVTAKPSSGDGGQPKELVTKQEMYSPLQLANTSPLPTSITSNRRRLRAVPPLLTCLRALWDFEANYSQTMSAPNQSNTQELGLFAKLAKEKHQELMLPMETLKADFLKSFLQNLCSELSPTAAWIGGQLAQDIINVLGAREQPIQNLVLFDGDEMKGPIYAMHPVFDAAALNGALAGNAPIPPMNGDNQVQQDQAVQPPMDSTGPELSQPPLQQPLQQPTPQMPSGPIQDQPMPERPIQEQPSSEQPPSEHPPSEHPPLEQPPSEQNAPKDDQPAPAA